MTCDLDHFAPGRRRSAPARHKDASHHSRGPIRAAVLALATMTAVALVGGGPARASVPAPGEMRTARYALALGHTADAAGALAAVIAEAPRSSAGIEAALLLAELRFNEGHADDADALLASAQATAPGGEVVHLLGLARGWMALGRGDGTAATPHFAATTASGIAHARDLGLLGASWSALIAHTSRPPDPQLTNIVRRGWHPALRLAAALASARLCDASGDRLAGVRVLRDVRHTLRETPFEDDIELALALAHLDAGQLASARGARERLARLARRGNDASARGGPTLTFDELRREPASLAVRIAALYAERGDALQGFASFAARLLDRHAIADLAALDALLDSAAGRSAGREKTDAPRS